MESRTFGFFNTHNEAYKAISENQGSMCESLYDYLVLEYIEEGIHPEVRSESWFKWDEEYCHPDMSHGRWISCGKPEEFRGICNWSIG